MPERDDLSRTILAANYEGVAFPVTDASAESGHDGPEHEAYGRRGADCEPTGQEPYEGSITAAFLNHIEGYRDLYPDTYRQLIEKFQTTPIGLLTHPFKGQFSAKIKRWRERFSSEVRNGAYVEFTFVEHNGEASVLSTTSNALPDDAPTTAESQAAQADTEMAATGATGYTPTSATITTQLAFLEAQVRSYAEIVSSINTMLAVVDGNLALSGFSSASAHRAIVALERLRATIFALRSRYLARFERVGTYTVQRPMALWQVALAVYGDASKTALITQVNSITDPLFIRAGTVLQILPVV